MKYIGIFLLFFTSITYGQINNNYIIKIFDIKTNIFAKTISKNKKIHNYLKKELNLWKILNKYNIDFYLIKGFKNYFPIERISFYSNHYCLNSGNKYNYCLVSSPFKNYHIKILIYPDYKHQYPYDIYGYYINNSFILVFLNIDIHQHKYLNQSLIENNFKIKQEFEGIDNIFKYFQKINTNVIIIGNFYTNKQTIQSYINTNQYKVLLQYKNFILTQQNKKINKIALLENTHIIVPKKDNFKIFSKIDYRSIKNFAEIYKLKKQNKILSKFKTIIGNFIPIIIQLKLQNKGKK